MNDVEHYEQAKRVLRASNPEVDFVLACHECGSSWPESAEMGMVVTHFQITHDTDEVELDLVWIGEGPPPEPRP